MGPVLGGVAVHHDDLTSLILPASTLNYIDGFQKLTPHITYEGYQALDPDRSLKISLRISNPYGIDISITKVYMKTFCHEHDVFLGTATGDSFPLRIPAKGDGILTIVLQFTREGKEDVLKHVDADDDLLVDLRDMTLVIQGIEASYTGDFEVGPISLK